MPLSLTLEDLKSRKRSESRLTPVEFDGYFYYDNHRPERAVKCVCDCGNYVRLRIGHYLRGSFLSCGCKRLENLIKRNTKYTQNHTKIYGVYKAMISRCFDPKNKQYFNYGGRGVTVCKEWVDSYESFLNWAIDRWQKGYDLDKDYLGNGMLYSPETCCFIPRSKNRGLTRRTNRIHYNGQIMSKKEICGINNIDPTTVNSRIERGWSFDDAVHTPLKINQYK